MSMPIADSRELTFAEAVEALNVAAGAGETPSTAWAPGRCTLVGEHVDYAGGLVLCVAVDLGIAAAVRRSATRRFLVTSGGATVTRVDPGPAGDLGDHVLAAVVAMRNVGIDIPAVEIGIAATLPAGAGLASSAALLVATSTAILRLTGTSMSARALAAVALAAEREVLGIPCGPLDQRAVIDPPEGGALLLDCRTGGEAQVPWPWADAVLVGCDTGTHHDVGGSGYRRRRAETERGLEVMGVTGCQELTIAAIDAASLEPVLSRRLHHVVEESERATEAVAAMHSGDLVRLGQLMSASHRSLRDLHEVSTPLLDAVVAAAESVPGCAGARMVGAGFGGTVAALVHRDGAEACRRAMAQACGDGRTFALRPSPGIALLAPDAIHG